MKNINLKFKILLIFGMICSLNVCEVKAQWEEDDWWYEEEDELDAFENWGYENNIECNTYDSFDDFMANASDESVDNFFEGFDNINNIEYGHYDDGSIYGNLLN